MRKKGPPIQPLLFAGISAAAWIMGSFIGLIIISVVAHHDQGSWQFWAVVMVLAALVGFGHSRFAVNLHPVANMGLSMALGLIAVASAFLIQPGLTDGRQLVEGRMAEARFNSNFGKLRYPSFVFLSGKPKTETGHLSVSFRTTASVAKVLQFYKWRLPQWTVSPVKGGWGTYELRPRAGSTQVIRIGDSIDHPGETEVIFHLYQGGSGP